MDPRTPPMTTSIPLCGTWSATARMANRKTILANAVQLLVRGSATSNYTIFESDTGPAHRTKSSGKSLVLSSSAAESAAADRKGVRRVKAELRKLEVGKEKRIEVSRKLGPIVHNV